MGYRRRTLDVELDELGSLPALELQGARGVGKTTTAGRRAATVIRLDEPARQAIARADPRAALDAAGPVLLDEWQLVPEIWDAVRRAVDDQDPPGPFLLTGSATPQSGKDVPPRHSGAGRIISLRMRPMALSERLDEEPTVSFSALLAGQGPQVSGQTDFGLKDYVREIVRSGFPGIRGQGARASRLQLESYLDRVLDHDFRTELGTEVRRPATLRRWLAAYGSATATTTSMEKIRKAAAPGEATPSRSTVQAYRDALLRLFILDPLDGWLPGSSHLKRLAQGPKHHLADPALAVSLLGLSEERLLRGEAGLNAIPQDRPFLGGLFESLTALSVRVFAQAADARTFHMRSYDGGHEVDLIVERPSGEVLALEAKLSGAIQDEDVRHLKWLRSRIGDRLVESVVITTGPSAYRRKDGICVVPLALLGP